AEVRALSLCGAHAARLVAPARAAVQEPSRRTILERRPAVRARPRGHWLNRLVSGGHQSIGLYTSPLGARMLPSGAGGPAAAAPRGGGGGPAAPWSVGSACSNTVTRGICTWCFWVGLPSVRS